MPNNIKIKMSVPISYDWDCDDTYTQPSSLVVVVTNSVFCGLFGFICCCCGCCCCKFGWFELFVAGGLVFDRINCNCRFKLASNCTKASWNFYSGQLEIGIDRIIKIFNGNLLFLPIFYKNLTALAFALDPLPPAAPHDVLLHRQFQFEPLRRDFFGVVIRNSIVDEITIRHTKWVLYTFCIRKSWVLSDP